MRPVSSLYGGKRISGLKVASGLLGVGNGKRPNPYESGLKRVCLSTVQWRGREGPNVSDTNQDLSVVVLPTLTMV